MTHLICGGEFKRVGGGGFAICGKCGFRLKGLVHTGGSDEARERRDREAKAASHLYEARGKVRKGMECLYERMGWTQKQIEMRRKLERWGK